MKNYLIVLMGVMVMLITMSNSSCESESPKEKNTADALTQVQTEELMAEAMKQVGMPNIDKFTEKKLLKMILELKDDENLICHAYLGNEFEGKVGQYMGRCIGYGVPAATQFSNPERIVTNEWRSDGTGNGGVYGTLPQPEPNGLFMPTSTDATWLILLDEKMNPRVCYIEPKIMVFPFEFKAPK